MTTLRQTLESLSLQFATEVIRAVRECSLSDLAAETGRTTSPTPTYRGRPKQVSTANLPPMLSGPRAATKRGPGRPRKDKSTAKTTGSAVTVDTKALESWKASAKTQPKRGRKPNAKVAAKPKGKAKAYGKHNVARPAGFELQTHTPPKGGATRRKPALSQQPELPRATSAADALQNAPAPKPQQHAEHGSF